MSKTNLFFVVLLLNFLKSTGGTEQTSVPNLYSALSTKELENVLYKIVEPIKPGKIFWPMSSTLSFKLCTILLSKLDLTLPEAELWICHSLMAHVANVKHKKLIDENQSLQIKILELESRLNLTLKMNSSEDTNQSSESSTMIPSKDSTPSNDQTIVTTSDVESGVRTLKSETQSKRCAHPRQGSYMSQMSSPNHLQFMATMHDFRDLGFLNFLSIDELKSRMSQLVIEMEAKIKDLRQTYAAIRQHILDAIDFKLKTHC